VAQCWQTCSSKRPFAAASVMGKVTRLRKPGGNAEDVGFIMLPS
jgi:hypothetical protein